MVNEEKSHVLSFSICRKYKIIVLYKTTLD